MAQARASKGFELVEIGFVLGEEVAVERVELRERALAESTAGLRWLSA
jgi:hypothetical protein